MTNSAKTITDRSANIILAPPRDLADFYLRWPEFRIVAAELSKCDLLNETEKDVLEWLVRLADRVGPRDFT